MSPTASLPGLDGQWGPDSRCHWALRSLSLLAAQEDAWEAVGVATDSALAGLSDGHALSRPAGGRTAGGQSWSDEQSRGTGE